jgi:hypothetical protein
MKIIIFIALCCLLQSCVGGSFLTSHEGIQINSKANLYVQKSEFKSIANGYSSSSIKDPGNPVVLENGNIEIRANCYRERLVSFSPSIIIPLPPFIPAFGSGKGSVNSKIELTLIAKNGSNAKIESIKSNNAIHVPVEEKNGIYTFGVMCTDVSDDAIVNLKGGETLHEVHIKYIKTYNFGWGWLSA